MIDHRNISFILNREQITLVRLSTKNNSLEKDRKRATCGKKFVRITRKRPSMTVHDCLEIGKSEMSVSSLDDGGKRDVLLELRNHGDDQVAIIFLERR